MTGMKKWNPRYVLYATAHGNTPEQQKLKDKSNFQYAGWITERWAEWRKLNGRTRWSGLERKDHSAFDAWLSSEVAKSE